MDSNLVSLNKLKDDIKAMKIISIFLKPEQRKQVKDMEKQIENMIVQTRNFNDRFSPLGWCAYDSMSFSLMEDVNSVFEQNGLEAAEQILINYYKSDVSKITYLIKNSSEAFAVRYDLINRFFEDHFAGRYHASVPLGLIIVDGAVNDYTKSKGFFAEGTETDAWDCLVGCSDGLSNLKNIFNQKRTKTNIEMIKVPYRNGIIHGRDLNYANEYVSCKCVCLMFAVADWMKMKDSEEKRKSEYEKTVNPPPLKESFARIKENRQIQKEISEWERKIVIIGKDIPVNGMPKDYSKYPYIVVVVEMLLAWKERNYGKLSMYMRKMFSSNISDKKRAGECRRFFEKKMLDTFEIIEIEERACALSKVVVKVWWTIDNCKKEAVLTLGCFYESNTEQVGLPWRNNGKWILMPWDIHGLYQ
ncbi:MAG: hypothetical protein NC433_17320 [Clostridiales bacterium]|nr:hypothetical protein [Clostridiales bacterium]